MNQTSRFFSYLTDCVKSVLMLSKDLKSTAVIILRASMSVLGCLRLLYMVLSDCNTGSKKKKEEIMK